MKRASVVIGIQYHVSFSLISIPMRCENMCTHCRIFISLLHCAEEKRKTKQLSLASICPAFSIYIVQLFLRCYKYCVLDWNVPLTFFSMKWNQMSPVTTGIIHYHCECVFFSVSIVVFCVSSMCNHTFWPWSRFFLACVCASEWVYRKKY